MIETLPLKVLLVDSDIERALALCEHLGRSGLHEVVHLQESANLLAQVDRLAPDIVIVDMDSPDRDALEDIRRVSAASPRPVILFSDQDDPGFMEEAIAAGVSSYNVTGLSLPAVKPIVAAAIALFRRHRQLEQELESAKASLEERRMIERAKGILISTHGFSEPDAYRWLRRRAMNEGRKIVSVALDVIKKDATDARRA